MYPYIRLSFGLHAGANSDVRLSHEGDMASEFNLKYCCDITKTMTHNESSKSTKEERKTQL